MVVMTAMHVFSKQEKSGGLQVKWNTNQWHSDDDDGRYWDDVAVLVLISMVMLVVLAVCWRCTRGFRRFDGVRGGLPVVCWWFAGGAPAFCRWLAGGVLVVRWWVGGSSTMDCGWLVGGLSVACCWFAVGLLVVDWCVAGLGAHGLLKLFPEFAGERSSLI